MSRSLRGGDEVEEEKSESTRTLSIAIGIDLFVDGPLVGVALASGTNGWILAGAMTLEVLFLGLSATVTRQRGGATRKSLLGTATLLGFLVILGALAGGAILSAVQSVFVHTFIIAFAAASLLYLVTEELLVEAHEEHDTRGLRRLFLWDFWSYCWSSECYNTLCVGREGGGFGALICGPLRSRSVAFRPRIAGGACLGMYNSTAKYQSKRIKIPINQENGWADVLD